MRDIGLTSSTSNISLGLWGEHNARDQIYVSGSGRLESVVNKQSTLLASVNVTNSVEAQLTLEHFVLLASFVSAQKPRYHLLRTQCYWYAYSIWQLLQVAFPELVVYKGVLCDAGRNKLIPWIEWHKRDRLLEGTDLQLVTSQEAHAALAAEYIVFWNKFVTQIPEKQNVSILTHVS